MAALETLIALPLDPSLRLVKPPAVSSGQPTQPSAIVPAFPEKAFLNAFGRIFPWGLDADRPATFGMAGLLGALAAGTLEGILYSGLQPWFAHQDIHPQIAALATVMAVAGLTFFSKEAGLGRLVDRAFSGGPGNDAGVRGAVAAAAVLLSWILRTQGLAQIYSVGEDISHPTAPILFLLPVTARLSETILLQIRRRGSIAPGTAAVILLWLAGILTFLQPAFVAALLMSALPALLLGNSIADGEVSGRDLTGLGEMGYLASLTAVAGLTMMY